MARDEPDDVLTYLQDNVDGLERLILETKMPNKGEERELEERLELAKEALATYQERQRHNLEAENNVILRGHSAFTANQDILDEGEYLYRVLATGAQGTEAGGPLLKDAPRVASEPGVKVLARAIEEVLEDETTTGTAHRRASADEKE